MLALVSWCLGMNLSSALGQESVPPTPEVPQLAEDSGEATSAIGAFKKPTGWMCELFAAEPMVGNPVAFTIDSQGRILVCESYRQGVGVTDNRSHDDAWLQADLSAMTVADRIAYHRKLLKDEVAKYESKDDLIRLLIDSDGDHVADESTVFASGFNALEEGTGAGVLVRDGKVYYTNIPNLWQLIDQDGDGVSDERISLASGFGVRVAFRGHDMHGLVNGPDGRIYFSIGDRGYHVQTPDGLLHNPESGAVFRCETDGSNLEVFATGLRNPQELAFDDFGNLFTGDNNSDSGDRARWVHVVRGGDSGWRMMYQYLPDRGPFNRERVWYPYDDQSPAYIVPPITNLSDGPSGLVCYPGTGLDDSYRNSFFLVDFRGQASNSGIRRIQMEPNGASFKVTANDEFIWNILATDVDFAPDGGLVVSDWVNGWNGENKGRLYRFTNPETVKDWKVEQTQSLLAEGMKEKTSDELDTFLVHPDRRVRQESQWELAARQEIDRLLAIASKESLAPHLRLHGLWGLGQIARGRVEADRQAVIVTGLTSLVSASDPNVAARAIDVIADSFQRVSLPGNLREAVEAAIGSGLQSQSPVVQSAACLAVEQLAMDAMLPKVLSIIEQNDNRDPVLRHSTIMALKGMSNPNSVVELARHANPAVRLAAVIALRKNKHVGIAQFLDDESALVSKEAIRAIHDVPELHSLMSQLADRIVGVAKDDAVIRRVLNANFRLGEPVNAQRLAAFASSAKVDNIYRIEALDMLANWGSPGLNDRVMNRFLPLENRDSKPAVDALRNNLENLAASPEAVRDRFLEVGATYGINGIGKLVEASYLDTNNAPARRAAALIALSGIEPDKVRGLLAEALQSPQVQLRVAGLKIAAKLEPETALRGIEKAIGSSEVEERQAAWDTLAQLPESEERDALIAVALEKYTAGTIPIDSRLNAMEAIEKVLPKSLQQSWQALNEARETLRTTDPVRFFEDSMEGGDVANGKLLFFTKASLSCVRCHKVGTTGGEVGPNLSEIGTKKPNLYLLEAIVAPNASIAEGFKTIIVQDDEGSIYSGIVKSEDDENLVLLDSQGVAITLPVESIEGRREGLSSMPADLTKYMSRRDIRDLVAYLKSLDGTAAATSGAFEAAGGHGLE